METVKESKGEEDEDDVPDLVGTNFEEASKQQWEAELEKIWWGIRSWMDSN